MRSGRHFSRARRSGSSISCSNAAAMRASLVDQGALRTALDTGHLACASLDVVDPEPLPAGHWIYSHPGIRLSAHISWSGPNMTERLLAPFIANVQAFSRGEPLQGLVDKTAGY